MDGLILINKPSGYTSHDIVNIVRKTLKTKKVGHCGTLDPDATGLLVVCVNKATKVLQFVTSENKEYIATLSLGKATDTYDASGVVTSEKEFNGLNDDVITILNSFLGEQEQVPPIYSAIKLNGKKLYEYARNNETVEIKPREIRIDEIELLEINNNEVKFRVKCSKGTYIRSLCVDIAERLGYPGHMSSLIRTASGVFDLTNSCTLEELMDNKYTVIPIEDALIDYQKIIIDDENIVYHGKLIKSDITSPVVVYDKNNRALAVYGPNGNGYLKNIRGLW